MVPVKHKLFSDVKAMSTMQWLRWALVRRCSPDSSEAYMLMEKINSGVFLIDALVMVVLFDRRTRRTRVNGKYMQRHYPILTKLEELATSSSKLQ